MCRGLKVLPGFNDLASRNPELAAEWHPTKNGKLGPSEVTYGSGKKVWWSGPCGHEWEASIVLRTNARTGCPFCRGLQIKAGDNDFASKHPDVAKEWHPKKNGSLRPTDVTSGVNLKVWWFGNCGHEWRANVSSRSQGHGCPLCVGRVSKPELELFNQLSEMVEDLRLNVMVHAPWGLIRQRQWARCDMVSDEFGVVVEYDGWFYHRSKLDDDVTKTEALIKAGWVVIRVRAHGRNPQEKLPELPNLPNLFTVDTRHGAGGQADAEMVFDIIAQQLSARTSR
ncbi:hypothetical protein GCM10009767_35650 [Kocuria aegyptia]|uniref:Treble clef zinc finger domain-containing protein n=2 Tax=Kocuria aegyptia TaxID=330943 RepID=A0ABN2L447_9MICC